MQIVEVTCDGCGADLTTRTNRVDYRLVLAAESKPGHGPGFYTAMMIYPAVERAHHFCGLDCLDLWRSREKHYAERMRGLSEAWKEQHATTRRADGRVLSYPCPPQELIDEERRQCRPASLELFPMKHAPATDANRQNAGEDDR